MKAILLVTQVITYIGLGVLFLVDANWRLGVTQLLLAAVQAIIYSEGL